MSEISAKDVMQLRKKMGVSMMACKKALVEASGDEEKAIEILRKSGIAKAAKKIDRETSEGAVCIIGKTIVKVCCETDFVARNEDFLTFLKEIATFADSQSTEKAEQFFTEKKADFSMKLGENLTLKGIKKAQKQGTVGSFVHFNNKIASVVVLEGGDSETAKEIAMQVVVTNPEVLSPDDVDAKLVEKEKEIWTEELKQSGKDEKIIVNILQGKEKKFRGENALLTQPFFKNDKITIKQFAKEKGAKVIEFIRMSL